MLLKSKSFEKKVLALLFLVICSQFNLLVVFVNFDIESLSQRARVAIQRQDWAAVQEAATAILKQQPNNAEGLFLAGKVERAANRPANALQYFKSALANDVTRYDAAVELANQYSIARQNGAAAELLDKYKHQLTNSSFYSDLAGTIYTEIGLPEAAYPLFKQAVSIQPKVDLFQANLASCSVYVGKISEAKSIYTDLLNRFPAHQRNHFQLSRLEKAKDETHIKQMLTVLGASNKSPDKNIFMYYALGKEYEDLGNWQKAFEFYKKGGDAVTSVANYNCDEDIEIIDTIIDYCNKSWLQNNSELNKTEVVSTDTSQPIFIVGLPRTGTTLCERIISNHSMVETLGETLFFQMALRKESQIQSVQPMNKAMLQALVNVEPAKIAESYRSAVQYRLTDHPFFIDKLPFNILYLGFFAKAFPKAKIVYLHRNPMDACFAMYKQVFTWAYKFSYSLDDLGKYYIAYNRLIEHWKATIGERLVQVNYEDLVADTDNQTRSLLGRMELPFEQACIDFDSNKAPSTTASSVQVRAKAHKNSVEKWRKFEEQLAPLSARLSAAGISL